MITDDMQAVELRRFGGPDTLVPVRMPRPVAGVGQALVRVRACGVCGHDLLARRGLLGGATPRVLGHEIAGEVLALGPGADGPVGSQTDDADVSEPLRIGDRVVLSQSDTSGDGARFRGETAPGGYAELVLAAPADLIRLPPGLSYVEGAVLPCGVGTGLHALGRLRVRAGETLLVVGVGGGVGVHAVALGHAAGLRVIALTRGERKREALLRAGADAVVAGATEPLAEIRRLAPDGVALAIDCAGPPTLELTLRALARGGRAALVGNVAGADADLAALTGRLIVRELTLLGSPHATVGELALGAQMVQRGLVRPMIAATLPLERAAEAHRLLEETAPLGRIVLIPDAEIAADGGRRPAHHHRGRHA